jgi:NAD-dependent DNA ligase
LEEQKSPTTKRVIVRSLNEKRIVFTGKMEMLRSKAKVLARKAEGIVQPKIGHQTDIVVLGDQSPFWRAGTKGQKLLDVDYERELGHRIAVIRESRFLALCGVWSDSQQSISDIIIR